MRQHKIREEIRELRAELIIIQQGLRVFINSEDVHLRYKKRLEKELIKCRQYIDSMIQILAGKNQEDVDNDLTNLY